MCKVGSLPYCDRFCRVRKPKGTYWRSQSDPIRIVRDLGTGSCKWQSCQPSGEDRSQPYTCLASIKVMQSAFNRQNTGQYRGGAFSEDLT